MLKVKTRQELANELGVSYHTLRRRIKDHSLNISPRKYLSPKEQKLIIEIFHA